MPHPVVSCIRFKRLAFACVVAVTVIATPPSLWGLHATRTWPNPVGEWLNEHTSLSSWWHRLTDSFSEGHAPPGLALRAQQAMEGRVLPEGVILEPAPPLEATQFLVPADYRLPDWIAPELSEAQRNDPDGPPLPLAIRLSWQVPPSAPLHPFGILLIHEMPGQVTSHGHYLEGLRAFLEDLTRYRRLQVTLVAPEDYAGDRPALLRALEEVEGLTVASSAPPDTALVTLEAYAWNDHFGGYALGRAMHVNLHSGPSIRYVYTTHWHEFLHVLGVPHPDSEMPQILWGKAYSTMINNMQRNVAVGFHHEGPGYLDREILDSVLGAPDRATRFTVWERCDVFTPSAATGWNRIFVVRSEHGTPCLAFAADRVGMDVVLDTRYATLIGGDSVYLHPSASLADIIVAGGAQTRVYLGQTAAPPEGEQRIRLQDSGPKEVQVLATDLPREEMPLRRLMVETRSEVELVFHGDPRGLDVYAYDLEGSHVLLTWSGGGLILHEQSLGRGVRMLTFRVPERGDFSVRDVLIGAEGFHLALDAMQEAIDASVAAARGLG